MTRRNEALEQALAANAARSGTSDAAAGAAEDAAAALAATSAAPTAPPAAAATDHGGAQVWHQEGGEAACPAAWWQDGEAQVGFLDTVFADMQQHFHISLPCSGTLWLANLLCVFSNSGMVVVMVPRNIKMEERLDDILKV